MTAGAQTPEGLLELLRHAWDAGDAAAYGRLFTEDATYVIFTGRVFCGRQQIQEAHYDVFTKWQKGSKLIVKPLQTTVLDADTAVVLTKAGVGTDNIEYDKFQTSTLVRRDGTWLITAFQNTEMSDSAKKEHAA